MVKRSRLSREGRMRIVPVKLFNQEAYARYQDAVAGWESGKGGFPYLPMYQFVNVKTGEPKKTGFVATGDGHHFYAKTKAELLKKVRK